MVWWTVSRNILASGRIAVRTFPTIFWPNPSQQGVKKTFSHLFSYPYPNISRKAFIKKVSFEIDIYDYMIYKAKAQLRIAVLSVLYTLKFKMF